MKDSQFTVKEILRKANAKNFDFYIVLIDYENKEFIIKINENQKTDIAKGYIFIGESVIIEKIFHDSIQISVVDFYKNNENMHNLKNDEDLIQQTNLQSFNSDIIENDLHKQENPLEDDITSPYDVFMNYCEDNRYRYLPFLTDLPEITEKLAILPYRRPDAVSVAEAGNRKLPIHGRVVYKSRILICKGQHPFFFFLVMKSGYQTLFAFFWEDKIKYFNSINCDDVLVIKNYVRKKKMTGDFNSINSFSEIFLFTGRCVDIKENTEIFKDDDVKKCNNILDSSYFRSSYCDIEGKIEVMSVLMRRRNTIENFSTCHDRIIDFYFVLIDSKIIYLNNNSQLEFSALQSGSKILIKNLWRIRRGRMDYYASSLFTNIKILCVEDSLIDNALCFIPDDYETYEDIHASTQNEIYGTKLNALFLNNLEYCTVAEIKHIAENLVINENKKVLLRVTLIGFHLMNLFKNDEGSCIKFIGSFENKLYSISITHLHNNKEETTETDFIRVRDKNNDCLDLLVFKNLLLKENENQILVKIFGVNEISQLEERLENEYVFTVDMFRSDNENVLICVSKGFLI